MAQAREALKGLASFGIWLGVVALPLMGIPLLLVVVLYLVLRRRGRRGGPDDSQVATPTPAQ